MKNTLDELIEENLSLIAEQTTQWISKYDIIDNKDGVVSRNEVISKYMSENNLITIEPIKGERIDLTAFGMEIYNSGGWLTHLKNREFEAVNMKVIKAKEEVKLDLEIKISKWLLKTKWLPMVIALVSLAVSIYALFK